MCAELQALEQEQRQIDRRAAEVETQLRSLMESGGWVPGAHSFPTPCPPSPEALSGLGRTWEERELEGVLWWVHGEAASWRYSIGLKDRTSIPGGGPLPQASPTLL